MSIKLNHFFILALSYLALNIQFAFSQTENYDQVISDVDSLIKNGKPEKAIQDLKVFLNSAKLSHSEFIETEYLLVESYLSIRNLDSSKFYIKDIRERINKGSKKENILKLLYLEGRYYFISNANVKALKKFIEGEILAENTVDKEFEMLNQLSIGRILYINGNPRKAVQYIARALKIAEKIKDSSSMVTANGILADNYINTKKFDLAEYHLKYIDSIKTGKLDEFALSGLYMKYYLNTGNTVKMYQMMSKAVELNSELKVFEQLGKSLNQNESSTKPYNEIVSDLESFADQYKNDLKDFSPFILEEYYKNTPTFAFSDDDYKKEIERLTSIIQVKQSQHDIEKYTIVNELETKYGTEKKEKENLILQKENAVQELNIEKERKQKWLFAIGLLALIITLLIFFYFYRRNQQQKKMITQLQRELHHNIKNNLAIVDAFLDETKEQIENENVQLKLGELQNRIESIGQVHRQLYVTEEILNLDTETYLQKLSENVSSLFPEKEVDVTIELQKDVQLPIEQIFPVGLIVNEFLTNSYKYAFPESQAGKIKMLFFIENRSFVMKLSDNGIGLPKDFDTSTLDSFGMEVMKILTEQLKGTFSLEGDQGVQLEIRFEKHKA